MLIVSGWKRRRRPGGGGHSLSWPSLANWFTLLRRTSRGRQNIGGPLHIPPSLVAPATKLGERRQLHLSLCCQLPSRPVPPLGPRPQATLLDRAAQVELLEHRLEGLASRAAQQEAGLGVLKAVCQPPSSPLPGATSQTTPPPTEHLRQKRTASSFADPLGTGDLELGKTWGCLLSSCDYGVAPLSGVLLLSEHTEPPPPGGVLNPSLPETTVRFADAAAASAERHGQRGVR